MPSERVQRRINSLLDDADKSIERRDWQSALELAEAALGFDPENSEAKSFKDAAKKFDPLQSLLVDQSSVQISGIRSKEDRQRTPKRTKGMRSYYCCC